MTKTQLSRRQFLTLLGVGLFIASCSGRGGEPDFTINITEPHFFAPGDLTIPVGARVAWKSLASKIHTVTADSRLVRNPANTRLPSSAEPFDSGDLYDGEIYTHTFHTPGEYIYFCKYHEDEGMIGTIRVEG